MPTSVIDKTFNGLVYTVLFFLPVLYLPGLTLHFELGKIVFLRITVMLMLFVFAIKIFKTGRIAIVSALNNSVIKKMSFWFLVILGLSVVFSIAPRVSFWGGYYRMQGVYMWLHYFLFFLLLLLNFHKKENWQSAFKFLFGGFFVTGALAVFQYFDLPIMKHEIWHTFPDRVFSGFGNPNYFAYYILMIIFPLFAVSGRYLKWVLFSFSLMLIFVTGSRAAILAFVFGFFAYFLLEGIFLKNKKSIITAIFLLFGSVAILLIINLFSLQNRLLFKGENMISIDTRLAIWRDVQPMIKDRIFFGYGPETFQMAFEDYADNTLFDKENLIDAPDKAYNNVLQILSDFGLIGLVYFLSALAMIVRLGIKELSHGNRIQKKIRIIAVLSALLAVFVADLFGFLVTVHYVILSFLLAYFLFLLSPEIVQKSLPADKWSRRLTITFVTVFTGASIVVQNGFYMAADFYANRGLIALEQGDANGVVKNLARASVFMPKQSYYNYLLSSVLLQVGDLRAARGYLDKGGAFDSYQDDFYDEMKAKLIEN